MKDQKYEQLKLENQICFPLYACARQVVNSYTPLLKPLGLTYTQYIVLMVLWESDGITVGEIGRRLFLDNGTLTPLLKKLEKLGLIERRRCSEDERVVKISLTDDGWQMREAAKDIPMQIAGSCSALGEQDARTLYTLLYRLLGDFEGKV